MLPPRHTRILLAGLAGTTVEFYDFYIYATAASLVFGQAFFPSSSPSAQLLASYASFALAFLARPVGAVVFGHFGDRVGRKSTLVASLLLMGVSTVLIGVLPTYAQIGWAAPALLCLLRFGQGFALGGEWGGAALLTIENAPPGFRARYGMVPQLGAPIGFIAANGLFLLMDLWLPPDAFRTWGWRLPFFLSAILVGVGLWVRLKLSETPEFRAALAAEPPSHVPAAELASRHGGVLVRAVLGVVASFALYYLCTAFALGYGVQTLHMPRRALLMVQLVAILGLAAGLLLGGVLADRLDPRRVSIAGCVAAMGVAALLAPAFASRDLAVLGAFLTFGLFAMGLIYGPLAALLAGMFPARVRYSGVSMAFNLAGVIGGGFAPILAQALADRGGLPWVGGYLAATALLSLAALLPRPTPV